MLDYCYHAFTYVHPYDPNLRNVTLCNVTPSLISQNPREHIFPSHTSWVLASKQSTKEFQTHPRTHYVIITIIIIIFTFVLVHIVTCYTNSLVSHLHVHIVYFLHTMCHFGCRMHGEVTPLSS